MSESKSYIKWTNKKIKLFKEIYPLNSTKDLMDIFNTSYKSIEALAVRLNLKKTKETLIKIHSQGQHKTGKKSIIINVTGLTFIYAPEHPYCNSDGYVLAHRYIMEQALNRYLTNEEIVLHKNGDVGDNRIENLEIKAHLKPNVLPLDVFNDRKGGMSVLEIRQKYGISINTYYRKLKKGEKLNEEKSKTKCN